MKDYIEIPYNKTGKAQEKQVQHSPASETPKTPGTPAPVNPDRLNETQLRDHAGQFDTFIFDLDGTLLDTLPDLTLLTNVILRELGYPEHPTEDILSFVGAGVRKLMYQALPVDASEEVCDEAMRLWNEYFPDYYHHTNPYPGVVDTLTELRARGCKIGVVSNKLQQGVDLTLSMRLPNLIDVMLGESPLIPRKPDPAGLEIALKHLNARPETALYVGDSPNDILAARNANLFAIAVTWGYHDPADFAQNGQDPDLFISAPEELLTLARPQE